MTQINAYLIFNGNCREAFTFYKGCFGGELSLQTVGESPMADQFPAGATQHILHASLVKGGLTILGSDMVPPEGLVEGNAISLTLVCSSGEELKSFFSNLSSGGQVIHPLHDFFAGQMGVIRDKYKKNWTLYYEGKSSNN